MVYHYSCRVIWGHSLVAFFISNSLHLGPSLLFTANLLLGNLLLGVYCNVIAFRLNGGRQRNPLLAAASAAAKSAAAPPAAREALLGTLLRRPVRRSSQQTSLRLREISRSRRGSRRRQRDITPNRHKACGPSQGSMDHSPNRLSAISFKSSKGKMSKI